MQRRQLLQMAGVLGLAGTAGCVSTIEDHFGAGLGTPVPIELYHEGSRVAQVTLEAYETGTNRQTYDESYTVRPDESVLPPHLESVNQRLRVQATLPETETSRSAEAAITPESTLVVVTITDDALDLEVNDGTESSSQNTSDQG